MKRNHTLAASLVMAFALLGFFLNSMFGQQKRAVDRKVEEVLRTESATLVNCLLVDQLLERNGPGDIEKAKLHVGRWIDSIAVTMHGLDETQQSTNVWKALKRVAEKRSKTGFDNTHESAVDVYKGLLSK